MPYKHIYTVLLLFLAGLAAIATPASALDTVEVEMVVLDAGHGGYDFGIRVSDTREKEVTLAIARAVSEGLSTWNKFSALTRKVDRFASHSERISAARGENPDVFVSIHISPSKEFNVYTADYPSAPKTVEAYYREDSGQWGYLYPSRRLADALVKSLAIDFTETPVSHQSMGGLLVEMAPCAAVVLEVPPPSGDLNEYIDDIAFALVQGILDYEHAR